MTAPPFDVAAVRAMLEKASKAPFTVGVFRSDDRDQQVAQFRETLDYGSGRCWCLVIPVDANTPIADEAGKARVWEVVPYERATVEQRTTAPLTAAELEAIAALPSDALAEAGHGWEPTMRLVGNVAARDVAAIGEAVPALLAHVVALAEQRDEAERRVAERIAAWLESWAGQEEVSVGRGGTGLYVARRIRAGAWKENPDG